jgi:hypothetical protein
MEAVKLQPREFHFTTLDTLVEEITKTFDSDYTFTWFCGLREWVIENGTAIKIMANRLTVPKLKELFQIAHPYKKERLVDIAYARLLEEFDIKEWEVKFKRQDDEDDEDEEENGGLINILDMNKAEPGHKMSAAEREHKKLLKTLRAVTLEDYEKKRAEVLKNRAEVQKALSNPESRDEFATFLRHKGYKALTDEQRAALDNLIANVKKEERQANLERNAVARKVELDENVTMKLIQTRHTKENYDLWVVQLNVRVAAEVYRELNNRARQMGGWYSKYAQGGAVPGFQFKTPQAADMFMQVKDQNVDTKELLWERQEKSGERRAIVLQSKGQALIEEGQAALQVERKTNTGRRARFASAAEQNAVGLIEIGKTLIAVGQGMDAGTVKYLEFMNNITEMDQLQRILSSAEYRYRQANNVPHGQEVPHTSGLAEYAEFPYPVLYRENVLGLLKKLAGVAGKRMSANRIGKAICDETKAPKGKLIITPGRIADFEKLFVSNPKGLDKWELMNFKERLMDFNRIYEKLKLQSPAEFRSALRELMTIEQGLQFLDPEQARILKIRNLERKFVGRNIPGFFPTPRQLGACLIDDADIQPGDVIGEPSAGLGHLADLIAELYPDNELICTEINYDLVEALKLKGHNAKHEDFLQDKPSEPGYDRIIMNPPFEEKQDNLHVMHAYNYHLKKGGKLVAIMCNNKENAQHKYFCNWVDSIGGTMEKNPDGSFISAFRPTGVSTITVVLYK